jgi:hypothetical protein
VYVDPTTGTIIRQYPDGSIASGTPGAVGSPGLVTDPNGNTTEGMPTNLLDPSAQAPAQGADSGAAAVNAASGFVKGFLVWLGALGVLWLFLTMLADSGNAQVAYALAGLILGGAVLYMGPQALKNAQTLFN